MARLLRGPGCDECNGLGMILYTLEDDRTVAGPCPKCGSALAAIAPIYAGNIPEIAAEWTWDTWPGPVEARRLGESEFWGAMTPVGPQWLYVHGDPGTGKTGVAICMMKTALQRRLYAAYYRVPDLLEREKDGLSDMDLAGAIRRLRQDNSLVILDDLGAERPTEYFRYLVIELLCGRYEGKRRTIITSNLDLNELAVRYDVRVADRLRQVCRVLRLSGRSLRHGEGEGPEAP